MVNVSDGAKPVDYRIESFIKHPSYNHYNKENDIALIELEKKVIFSAFIRPACLHQHQDFIGMVVAVADVQSTKMNF